MLEVRDLHAAYGDAPVLFGASLSVKEGEIVALVGSNGAGKTTLIRCVTGLLRRRRGTIEFKGDRIETHPAHDTRVRIYSLRAAPMVDLRAWLDTAARGWTEQLSAFAEHLERKP